MNENQFHEVLTKNCDFFTQTCKYYFEQFSQKKLADQESLSRIEVVSRIKNDYVLSISFLGMVFGEYIIAISHETASQIFSEFSSDEESLEGLLSEILNMIAGKSITSLGGSYDKLTITAPKIIQGQVKLPQLKIGQKVIESQYGAIQCYFYVDRMKLDLASSYLEAMTDLKKINHQLTDANNKLKEQQSQLVHQEKMASLGVMASGVAHEINNPLAYVSGNIEVLTSYVEALTSVIDLYEKVTHQIVVKLSAVDPEILTQIEQIKTKENINFIMKDTVNLIDESRNGLERIKKIVAGLKKFSKPDDEFPTLVDLNEEIKNVLLILNGQVALKGCEVKLYLDEIPKLRCYPNSMAQVFSNLIMNSIQAVSQNVGLIEIRGTIENNELALSIKDNGVGIPPEALEKIFNPFYTTRPVGQGVGLGLAITYGLIQKHHGRITVSSQLNSGTEFQIRLPLNEDIRLAG